MLSSPSTALAQRAPLDFAAPSLVPRLVEAALESALEDDGRTLAMLAWPDTISIELQPPGVGQAERVQSLWHAPKAGADLKIALRSRDTSAQRVRLRFEIDRAEANLLAVPDDGMSRANGLPGGSDDFRFDGWQEAWARWDWERRVVPEDLGGVAAEAQDAVAEDNSLVLLLLPGETRVVEADFDIALRPGAAAGDYPLSLVLSALDDATIAEQAIEDEDSQRSGVQGERELEVAPMMIALRHAAPRWMAHLPGIYHSLPEPPVGSSGGYAETPFLNRFLKGFEDSLEPLQTLVGHLDEFFGAMSAPPDFLPWLATWVGLALDENWPQLKRRRLIREAAELYRWRGTRRGLERYLEIYTGYTPHIQDQPFSGMRLGQSAILGQSAVVGHIAPHTFRVTLLVEDEAAVSEETVRAIIESHKPAHTAYELRIVPLAGSGELEIGD